MEADVGLFFNGKDMILPRQFERERAEVGSLYMNKKKIMEKVLKVVNQKPWLVAQEEIDVIADWKS